MLFRLDNPRMVMNAQEFPENMVLYCLAYADCAGDVVVNYIDPTNSRRVTQPIQPTRSLSIFAGVTVNEYVLPFNSLADNLGRRGATSGFTVIGRSSYRLAGADYQTRTLEFTMVFPVIGGGIIRLRAGEQEWDIANPTFNPRASIPQINRDYGVGAGNEYVSGPSGIDNQRVPDDVLINAYQRTHRGFIGSHGSEIEQRRQQRLANFDLSEAVPQAPPIERPPMATPARQGRTSVITGSPRVAESGPGMSPAQVAAEERRQARLNQIRQAEGEQNPTGPILFGVDPAQQGTSSVSIVTPVARKPKAPPKTRFERIQANCEEANESKK
jgi:hypothetical protein